MSSPFLQALAQPRPDPGGGAAAAHGAALGLALLEKVVRLELRRPGRQAKPGSAWHDLLARVQQAAEGLARLQEEDIRAYGRLAQARTTGDSGDLPAALEEAMACPRRIMQQAREGLDLVARIGAGCKLHLISDLLVACELLGGACRGAHHIACASLPLISEISVRQTRTRELGRAMKTAETRFLEVRTGLLHRQACL
jgi:formiminotetrahydrofolate cyclodeaminase